MEKQKRKIRTYKMAEKPYKKAQKRAPKTFPLSTIIERFVEEYGKKNILIDGIIDHLEETK